MNPKFHLWLPDIFQFTGGIQTYSSFFLQALQALYPQSCFNVLLKNDSHSSHSNFHFPQTQFHYFGTFPSPLRTLTFATQALRYGILQAPDLVISTHLNFTIVSYLLKQFTGIPYWTVAHGDEAWDIQSPLLKLALKNADRILAVSHYTRDRLLNEQNLDPDKVVFLPNTFDPDRFSIESKPATLLQKYGLKPNQPIILTVARLSQLEQYKGYDQILRALPQIRHRIPNIHYILVGKGDDRLRIEQLISQLQLQDCVTLTGYVPDEELAAHYHLCDVFAMPSKAEGFGIVYLEALASGKPALGGNQDGAIDALCHGELGVLVNPDDVNEIANNLINILLGNYPNKLFYNPHFIRQKVFEKFGFKSFKKTLGNYLEQHFNYC
ncbi:glycosyltransferase family 4 protein [Moorena producens]|uniref:glycosyltransferase family 4 protein n=1 Tax=Moorena producens TaxID=1155739 RepID=UPI003C7678E2